ncbi:Glycogen debranching enzyme GlgX [Planctomycetales bacterium 10988]|nr:Glycogen debranching enzyme GlgX [Planctomycetales bacterium 10988]
MCTEKAEECVEETFQTSACFFLLGRAMTFFSDERPYLEVEERMENESTVSSPTVLPETTASPTMLPTAQMPFGAFLQDGGVLFVVYSHSATGMRVLLYDHIDARDPSRVISMNPKHDRFGDVWSVFVPHLKAGQLYHFQADGPFDPHRGHRFDGKARLIDPWSHALAGDYQTGSDKIVRPPRSVVIDETFDWQGDRRLGRPMSETIIYEMHVRGFTQHRSSGVEHPGTYLGVIEKIPYLQSLGVTAVELLPVHEFPILGTDGRKLSRSNYWGYDPMAYFSPHRGYACSPEPGAQVREFKEMVRALHAAGIEVILDVVFNHTCEGNEHGPTISFKGLENRAYYILTDDRQGYKNYSGCGNTFNSNHPVVRELILHCLRHWVLNYHIDGFRFDLASILCRGRHGEMLPHPPIVERISEDPVLADTKLIAEAWDAAGAFQVGSFPGARWSEWNGRYRDDLRRYWRGDPHLVGACATRLTGSSDLYQHSGRHPYHSVNFITSHDGFTLNDLVSYNQKHNDANGEGNRDGDNNNNSFNFGVEGPTKNRGINKLRTRQLKNMLSSLLLSMGVPMLVAGDELQRTQRGNNNAYCQDNAISWFNWRYVRKHPGLVRFVRNLIRFRRQQPSIRLSRFLTGHPQADGEWADVSWYSPNGNPMHWEGSDSSLICVRPGLIDQRHGTRDLDLLLVLHPGSHQRHFQIPQFALGRRWYLFVDTAAESPEDIYPDLDGPELPLDGRLVLPQRCLRCYISRQESTKKKV